MWGSKPQTNLIDTSIDVVIKVKDKKKKNTINWSSSGSLEPSLELADDRCRDSNSCLAAASRAATSGGAPT